MQDVVELGARQPQRGRRRAIYGALVQQVSCAQRGTMSEMAQAPNETPRGPSLVPSLVVPVPSATDRQPPPPSHTTHFCSHRPVQWGDFLPGRGRRENSALKWRAAPTPHWCFLTAWTVLFPGPLLDWLMAQTFFLAATDHTRPRIASTDWDIQRRCAQTKFLLGLLYSWGLPPYSSGI